MVMMFDWMLPVGVAYQTLRGSHDMGEFGKEASPKDDPNNPPQKKKTPSCWLLNWSKHFFNRGKVVFQKIFLVATLKFFLEFL